MTGPHGHAGARACGDQLAHLVERGPGALLSDEPPDLHRVFLGRQPKGRVERRQPFAPRLLVELPLHLDRPEQRLELPAGGPYLSALDAVGSGNLDAALVRRPGVVVRLHRLPEQLATFSASIRSICSCVAAIALSLVRSSSRSPIESRDSQNRLSLAIVLVRTALIGPPTLPATIRPRQRSHDQLAGIMRVRVDAMDPHPTANGTPRLGRGGQAGCGGEWSEQGMSRGRWLVLLEDNELH